MQTVAYLVNIYFFKLKDSQSPFPYVCKNIHMPNIRTYYILNPKISFYYDKLIILQMGSDVPDLQVASHENDDDARQVAKWPRYHNGDRQVAGWPKNHNGDH